MRRKMKSKSVNFNASDVKNKLHVSIGKKISDSNIKFPLVLSTKLGCVCIREYNTGRLYDIIQIDKIVFNPKNPHMPQFVLKVMDVMGDKDEYTVYMDDNDFDVETLKALHRVVYFTLDSNPDDFSFDEYNKKLKDILKGTVIA